MTITNEERERRRQTLGSSDVAAILGYYYPHRTAADVQISKIHQLEPEEEKSGPAKVGRIVERALCEYAAEERSLEGVIYSPPAFLHDLLPFHANLDAYVPGKCVIEAKSTSLHDEWGEPGTDDVPEAVVIQDQWQLGIIGLEIAINPVMYVGLRRDAHVFDVQRNDRIIDALFRMMEQWWMKHVVERRPIEDSVPTMQILQRVVREPGSTTIIHDLGALDARRITAANLKAAKAADEEAKGRIVTMLGDAEAGTDELGNVLVSYPLVPAKQKLCKHCNGVASERRAHRRFSMKGLKEERE